MGIPAKSLRPSARAAAGIKLTPAGNARIHMGDPLFGYALLELTMEPPTVTHHAKVIVRRGPDGRHTLADSPALLAARAAYERAIPERTGHGVPPLLAPVVMRVTFTFRRPDCLDEPQWHVVPPDLDNQVKLLKDVLAVRGYVRDDAEIALEVLAKRVGAAAGVRVYLRTLKDADDLGAEYAVHPDYRRGTIYPLPPDWVGAPACCRPRDLGERPIGAHAGQGAGGGEGAAAVVAPKGRGRR